MSSTLITSSKIHTKPIAMSTKMSVDSIVKEMPNTSSSQWRRRVKYQMHGDCARVFENVDTGDFCTVYQLSRGRFIVKSGNCFPNTDPELKKRLISAGNKIKHCGDYCNMYWNPSENIVWMCMGDGDCPSESDSPLTSYTDIQRLLRGAGAKDVIIEAEHSPHWNDEYKDHDSNMLYYEIPSVKGITVDFEW